MYQDSVIINISHSQSIFPPLYENNSLIQTKPFITNLGFIFNTNLNYDMHISNIGNLFNLYIYIYIYIYIKICSIRKCITTK